MHFTKDTRRTILIGVLLGGITLAAFWPVVYNDFISYDDTAYVTENPQVLAGMTWAGVGWAFRSGYFGNWHPLTWLSHMLDVQLFGLQAGWHHLTSLLFHAANAALLFLLLQRLTDAAWRSASVAALFALHPLHVESVAWVSERKDVLSGFFFMLTLLAYVRYVKESGVRSQWSVVGSQASATAVTDHGPRTTDHGPRNTLPSSIFYLLSLAFFALGLMSKAMVVTLPFVMLLLDFWPLRRFELSTLNSQPSTLWRLVLEKLPFFAVAVISSGVAFLLLRQAGATNEPAEVSLGDRLIRMFVCYEQYLGKTIWPAHLALPYPRPVQWPRGITLAGAGCVISLSVSAIWLARRRPYVPVGWFWFLGMLLPVIGLVPVGAHMLADRYTYLPLIGLFMGLIWGASEIAPGWRHRRLTLAAAASGALLVCLAATRQQVSYWHDSERLFRHALQVTRDNYLAHNGLGLQLFKQGRVEEALRHYEAALQINPLYDDAHSNLGRALTEKGNYGEAVAHFETALSLRPDDVKTRNNFGSLLALQGRQEEAARQFEEAVRLNPDHAGAHNNLAISCRKLGRIGEAIAHYRAALRLQPDSPEALNNLAWLLAAEPDARFRNGPEAVPLATRACELTRYENPVPLATLAAAYAETGRFPEAVSFAELALQLARSGQGALGTRLSAMLEAFRAGRAYHAE